MCPPLAHTHAIMCMSNGDRTPLTGVQACLRVSDIPLCGTIRRCIWPLVLEVSGRGPGAVDSYVPSRSSGGATAPPTHRTPARVRDQRVLLRAYPSGDCRSGVTAVSRALYTHTLYHPEHVVTRGPMAIYVARAFGLL